MEPPKFDRSTYLHCRLLNSTRSMQLMYETLTSSTKIELIPKRQSEIFQSR